MISYLLYARINGGSENLAHKWDQYSAVVLAFIFIAYNVYWCGSIVWEYELQSANMFCHSLSDHTTIDLRCARCASQSKS